MSSTIQPQRIASGISAQTASRIATVCSSPEAAVTTSNHASQRSIVPVNVARAWSQGERRSAAIAVAANATASAMSNPTQASR